MQSSAHIHKSWPIKCASVVIWLFSIQLCHQIDTIFTTILTISAFKLLSVQVWLICVEQCCQIFSFSLPFSLSLTLTWLLNEQQRIAYEKFACSQLRFFANRLTIRSRAFKYTHFQCTIIHCPKMSYYICCRLYTVE